MAMSESDQLFTEAPPEVTRYFDAKRSKPSVDWRDVAPYEHAVSFTVARTAGYDVIDDIRAAASDVIRNYGDFGQFVDDLEPVLRRKGWWGRKVDAATGEAVQLGSLHRLRTIYWANKSTARAAGEWERIQRTKRALPFLMYGQSRAENKRPLHLTWVGTILLADDPWWATHYPPNGWLCQCRAEQISRREAMRRGYDPDAPAPEIETFTWTNKRTGEVVEVPMGIDPGWQTNPGMTRAANVQQLLSSRIEAMSEAARDVAVKDIVGSRLFRAIQANEFGYDPARAGDRAMREVGHIATPVAALPADVAELLGAEVTLVHFSVADAAKHLGKPERAAWEADLYGMVQHLILNGSIYRDMKRGARNHNFVAEIEGKIWSIALQQSADRKFIFLKSMRRARPDDYSSQAWQKVR